MSFNLNPFDDHRAAFKIRDYILFSDEYRDFTRNLKVLEQVQKIVFVLKNFYDVIDLIAKQGCIFLKEIRKSEIIAFSKSWHRCKSYLSGCFCKFGN